MAVDVHSTSVSSPRRCRSACASRSIPLSAALTSRIRGAGANSGSGASPSATPGWLTALSSTNRIPNSTSRTWSVYFAMDHMSGRGRLKSSSTLRSATPSTHWVGSRLIPVNAASSVQPSLSKPHWSQRSIFIDRPSASVERHTLHACRNDGVHDVGPPLLVGRHPPFEMFEPHHLGDAGLGGIHAEEQANEPVGDVGGKAGSPGEGTVTEGSAPPQDL